MNLKQLLKAPPLLHDRGNGQLTTWKLADPVLEFMEERINETSITLETGAGLSTILCAIRRSHHTCVVSQQDEADRIERYCYRQQIPTDRIRFLVGSSDRVLPRLDVPDLDLLLLDGGHGFPMPFIDWHYAAPALKVGGTLIIDNTELWTCGVLMQFLREEPGWQLELEFVGWANTAVFTKRQAFESSREWCSQPYVVRRSAIGGIVTYCDDLQWLAGLTERRIAWELLRRGRFARLARRLWKRLRGSQP